MLAFKNMVRKMLCMAVAVQVSKKRKKWRKVKCELIIYRKLLLAKNPNMISTCNVGDSARFLLVGLLLKSLKHQRVAV